VLPYYKLATQKAVVFAHHLGLKVVSWTINDEKIALLMYYRKVDGIATDYPDKIIKLRDMLVS
jgi:glycerophosphoryl diester phosphodiesterase